MSYINSSALRCRATLRIISREVCLFASCQQFCAESLRTVITALNNFANVTLSSLYFDITKDCLYAGSPNGIERRSILTVFERVLQTMTSVIAPVLPHLAEEIHHHYNGGGDDISKTPSAFTTKWQPLVCNSLEFLSFFAHHIHRSRNGKISALNEI